MKYLLLVPLLLLNACVSMTAPQLGMDEKTWLRRTLIADLVSVDGNERVYKSNGAFYYFQDGKLARVGQGRVDGGVYDIRIHQ